MAQAVGISVSDFQKSFKTQTETSPITYLHELCLEKTKELLENTFLQVN